MQPPPYSPDLQWPDKVEALVWAAGVSAQGDGAVPGDAAGVATSLASALGLADLGQDVDLSRFVAALDADGADWPALLADPDLLRRIADDWEPPPLVVRADDGSWWRLDADGTTWVAVDTTGDERVDVDEFVDRVITPLLLAWVERDPVAAARPTDELVVELLDRLASAGAGDR
ncbi:hypothetical protein [Umezawaea sp. Da 62-37]|uniref:hypothetical protein n=1 Tax=Umezawaea sp. Da 62-37 TaxID=3075927 RepID=UPI0028F72080|nr:hypothetical protein [Umezawaea sp. Da 62-37]WNV87994.1 hypothetical protein RM788_06820 [Umezawaea sp. Da 62-37]